MRKEDVRNRIIMLVTQEIGIEAEIKALRQIPCEMCGEVIDGITPNKGFNVVKDATGYEFRLCTVCDGTGLAVGRWQPETR